MSDRIVTVTASGPAAETPEGRKAIAAMKGALVMVDEAWGPYRTTPQGNRAQRRKAAAVRRAL